MSASLGERELVVSAQAHDSLALSGLFETFFPKLFRYGLRNLGNAGAAEDFAADVMVSVLESIDRYRVGSAPLSAWVFRIARNRLIDMSRRSQRRRICALSWDVPAEAGTHDEVERHLAGVAVREAVQGLPADQRLVIMLRFFWGCDTAATAGILGRSEASVKSLRFRALRSLRRSVTGHAHPAELAMPAGQEARSA